MTKRRGYRELPDIELDPALDEKVRRMTAVADQQLEEIRVNFRWRRQQLDTVKRAAALLGIPYQTFIKQVAFRQAVRDILDVESAVGRSQSS